MKTSTITIKFYSLNQTQGNEVRFFMRDLDVTDKPLFI
jgi:hypothetical protein